MSFYPSTSMHPMGTRYTTTPATDQLTPSLPKNQLHQPTIKHTKTKVWRANVHAIHCNRSPSRPCPRVPRM
jgi:hypothetical protein